MPKIQNFRIDSSPYAVGKEKDTIIQDRNTLCWIPSYTVPLGECFLIVSLSFHATSALSFNHDRGKQFLARRPGRDQGDFPKKNPFLLCWENCVTKLPTYLELQFLKHPSHNSMTL